MPADPRPDWADDIATLREHVDDRLAKQDEKLDELLAILRASKMGVAFLKGAAALAATVVAAWAAWKGVR